MSRPSSNSLAADGIPSAIQTSRLTAPLVRLASCSHEMLTAWIGASRIFQLLRSGLNPVLSALYQRLESFTWMHQGLFLLHGLVSILILILATFASTGLIGAAVIGAFSLLILRWLTRPLAFTPTILDGAVTVFFLTAVVATLFSSYTYTSLVGLFKFSVFYAGYINFRVLIGERTRVLTLFLTVLTLLGFAESLIGFYQYINHVQPLATWQDPGLNPEDKLTRIFGTLKPYNPNLLAGFLIPCLAAGLCLTFQTLFSPRWWLSLPLGGMSLSILAALVLTGSRGGYLAILTMGIITFLFLGHLLWHEPELKERYKLKALWILCLVGSVIAAVGALMAMPAVRTRLFSIFAMREDSSNSYRMNVWLSTIEMIKDNWLVGIGPGNDTFKQVYGLYMVPGYNALSAYSIFLEIWAEQGIFGLLSFFLIIGLCKMRSVLVFYSALKLDQKLLTGFLLTGIMGSLVYGLFDTIWYRPSVNLLFWLLVAGLAVVSEKALPPTPQSIEVSHD